MSVAFHVSRTPVRESFVRLAQEGLVLVVPQRGTRVALIDPELVEEARFMREQLERAVIRLACEKFPEEGLVALADNLNRQKDIIKRHDNQAMFVLDEEFHRILFAGCRKLGTWNIIQQMNAHLNRTRVLWLTTDPHWENLYEQHRSMLEAVTAHDAERADRLMKEHLQFSVSNLPALLKRYPGYFTQSGKSTRNLI